MSTRDNCRRKCLCTLRKSIITQAKKLPSPVLYGTQILYFNPMIFRLEHLSLIENIVKHIHLEDHIQDVKVLQQSYIISLCFFCLLDLNCLDKTCAKRTYYLFFTAQNMKCSIKDFFSECDRIHKKLLVWSHLLKKSSMENFIFCAMFS